MNKVTILKSNFTSGEVSPLLKGRSDLEQYANGADKIENFATMPYGGLIRIPGTYFVSSGKIAGKAIRLIPFQFSVTQAYMLEVGEEYIRFYMEHGQIQTTTMPITGATQANPCVITSANHPFQNGDKVTITGVSGMTQLNGNEYTVANRATNTFELAGINSTAYGAYTSGGTATRSGATEIPSPYQEDELYELGFAQDKDVMWIVHPNHKPRKLQRTAHTSWTLVNYAPTADIFTSTDNYPRAITIYQQRLFFGGSNTNPQTMWGSKSNDYNDMTQGVADDDALQYTIGAEQVNIIRWLKAGVAIEIGTSGGIFSLSSGSDAIPLTPTNVVIVKMTNIGAMQILPKEIGGLTFYAQRTGKRIRQLSYSLERDKQEAIDMTLISKHILGSGIRDMDYQQSPYNMLWCITEDGQLAIMTRLIEQQVTAWARRITDVVTDEENFGQKHKWGGLGSADGEFNTPSGAFVYEDEVYVADQDNNCIQVFNLSGTFQRKWGSSGSGDGEFNDPCDAFVYNNEVYVVDRDNNRIQVFDTDGVFQRKWGSLGSGNGEFDMPQRIFVDGEVYVTDSNNHRVQVSNTAGVFQRKWGTNGNEDGEFERPTGICVHNSKVYVGDYNSRIQVFDTNGTFQKRLNIEDAFYVHPFPGLFTPIDIQIDNNLIYFIRSYSSRIAICDLDGNLLYHIIDATEADLIFGFYKYEDEFYLVIWNAISGECYIKVYGNISGQFQSVGVIPQDNADDEVWIVATRYINGSIKSYIEYFMPFNEDIALEDAFFVDSGLTYDGAPATTISGLDHLEGRTVDILADGVVVTPQVVTSGAITLATAASKVQVGLPYDSTVKLLPIESVSELGTAQSKIQKVNKISLRVYNSLHCKVGTDDQMDEVKFDEGELNTGIKEVLFPQGHGVDVQPVIKQTDPLPLTLLSIIPRVDTKD